MKFLMSAILAMLAFTAHAQLFSHGTCVIVKRTNDAIYVGADSRVITESRDGSGNKIIDTSLTCKIHINRKYNYVISGIYYDVANMEAIKACKSGGSFRDVINRYTTSYIQKFKELAGNSRRVDSVLYRDFVLEKKLSSKIIFFGWDNDSLYTGMLSFAILDPSSDIDIEPSLLEDRVLIAGNVYEIADTVFKESSWIAGEIPTIRNLMKIEMKAHFDVGGDIDILKFTKEKLIWIQRKRMCY